MDKMRASILRVLPRRSVTMGQKLKYQRLGTEVHLTLTCWEHSGVTS